MTTKTLPEALNNNDKIELKINAVSYQLAPLSVGDVYAPLLKHVRDSILKDATEVANLLQGKEKTDFMISVWKSLPKGEELANKLQEAIFTLDGMQIALFHAISKVDKKITFEEVKVAVSDEAYNEYLFPYLQLLGIDPSALDDTKDGEIKQKN
jgi:hypothetical protein